MQYTTASQYAKFHGMKSLKEVADMTNQSSETLINWYKKKRELFEVVIVGCVVTKRMREMEQEVDGD